MFYHKTDASKGKAGILPGNRNGKTTEERRREGPAHFSAAFHLRGAEGRAYAVLMYDASADRFSVPGKQFFPSPARRLRFRLWTESDRKNFRRLNRNAQVMRFFPAPLSSRASDALLERFMAHQQEEGFGVWPVEVLDEEGARENRPRFAGFAGLLRVRFAAPFLAYSDHPPVEIGWRFLPEFWGQGLACEAARASLAFGFHLLNLEEVVSFTAVSNTPSRRLMVRLGMTHDPDDDFDHPSLPDDHPLLRHVLYRLAREAFH